MSMLDMTKRDIADAQQQGIMTPPPADAAWYARLIHQAKELFVRNIALRVSGISL
jgi:LETM1 and EF-hand domain-containing protein 1, mitochondrial